MPDTNYDSELRAALVRLATSCGVSWQDPREGFSVMLIAGVYTVIYKQTKILLKDLTVKGLITQMDTARFLIELHDEAFHGTNPFRI